MGQVIAGLCVLVAGLLLVMAWQADDWEGMVRFSALATLVVVVLPVFVASVALCSICRPRPGH